MNEESLGQRIRSYRQECGYSLSELAKRSGVSRTYMYQIERDECSISVDKLQALVEALDVSMPDILGIQVDASYIRLQEAKRLLREWKELGEKTARFLEMEEMNE